MCSCLVLARQEERPHDSFIFVARPRLRLTCTATHACDICDKPHSCVTCLTVHMWHDSVICDMPHSHVAVARILCASAYLLSNTCVSNIRCITNMAHRTCSWPIHICVTLLCHICVPYLFCIRVPRLIHTCVPWKLILILFVITCSAKKAIFSQSLLPNGPISSPAPVFHTNPSACERPAPDCGEPFLYLPSECMRLEKGRKEGVPISRLSQWLVCCVWERIVVCDSMLRVSDALCVIECCVCITLRCECEWVLVCDSIFGASDFKTDPNQRKSRFEKSRGRQVGGANVCRVANDVYVWKIYASMMLVDPHHCALNIMHMCMAYMCAHMCALNIMHMCIAYICTVIFRKKATNIGHFP